VTVGRREGEPNITVIYDGEIIRGMTREKRFSRESRRSLQTGAGDAGATRGSAGSLRQSGGAYQDTPDISHVAEAEKLFHDTRRERQAPVVAASSRPALPGHSGSVFSLARLRAHGPGMLVLCEVMLLVSV
jgi:hypothetical protein